MRDRVSMSNKSSKLEIKKIVLIALMTAMICVISPFAVAIPISPVPISLATFAIYLVVILLGCKDGTLSVLIYVVLGFAGAPVFTGFTGGVAKVLGPTGGYIIGYVFLALIEGLFVKKARESRQHKTTIGASIMIFAGMLLGTVVLYIFGTFWLAKQSGMTLLAAFFVAVVPFVIGDIVKMIIALFIGKKIRSVLINNNLL